MEKRLYEASLSGSVSSLTELLEEDQLILDGVVTGGFYGTTPLHIAAMRSHVDFAIKVLSIKPELASEIDSQGFSPLHLACSRKNVRMVEVLLDADPYVCKVLDQQGMIPLHLAAMRGRVEIMTVLFQAGVSDAIHVLLDRRETILHLCVKHNRLEPLKLLVDHLMSLSNIDDEESISVRSADDDGNTIMHLAVARRQLKMIRYLIESNSGVELVNASNKKGLTALGILEQSIARDLKDMEISDLLLRTQSHIGTNIGGLVNNEQPLAAVELDTNQTPSKTLHRCVSIGRENSKIRKYEDWLNEKSNSLLVAASLLAAMAFQAAMNPPGGVWQEDGLSPLRYAGTAIMADKNVQHYKQFLIFNTLGFVFSMNTVLLLVSELPLKKHFFFRYLALSMWAAAFSMAISYIVVLVSMLPSTHTYTLKNFFWGFSIRQSLYYLMAILFFFPVCYLFVKSEDYFAEKFSGEDLSELNKLEKET
ncbi:hypothetical protein MKW98_019025 [Papaver atlanticum]|uniref:PGG domain-containing protein n=1 Tax=Papaver atlanticum TaxID=357466 RepID=A0AAD4TG57_9MAGN|nr:hypothetical protein MKW98_019025 [Papaver atlanticum]